MAIALRLHRRLWVAVAAVAAMLPGVASAADGKRCETMPAGCTACACCEDATSATAPAVAAVAMDRSSDAVRPAPCSCRADEPTTPARLPDRGDEGRRVDAGRMLAADEPPILMPLRPSPPIAFMPDVGPPRSPVYLRISRLLI